MSEKRNYFRVTMQAILEALPVTDCAMTLSAENAFETSSPLCLYSSLRRIDNDNQRVLKSIQAEQPQIAQYLVGLNQKVDILTQHLLPDFEESEASELTQSIDLSEDGASFLHPEKLEEGAVVALRVVFMPHFSSVSCYGRVLRCDQLDRDMYQVAVKFERLTEMHRQEIVKQLFKTQTDSRKQQ